MFHISALGCPEIILLSFVSMLKNVNFTTNRQVDQLNLQFIS